MGQIIHGWGGRHLKTHPLCHTPPHVSPDRAAVCGSAARFMPLRAYFKPPHLHGSRVFRDTLSRGIRRDVRGGGSLSWLWSPGPGRIVGSFLTIGETTVASCIGMCASVVLSRTEGGLVPFYPQARFWSPHHPLGSGEDAMLHFRRVYRLLSEVQFWLSIRDRGTLWM